MAEIKKQNRFSGLMQTIREESDASASTALSSSIPQFPTTQSQAEILCVPRHKVHRDPGQDRRYFDETELDHMAASMSSIGIIDPLTVRKRPGAESDYELLAGEKRHRAAERAGLEVVPIRVFDVDDRLAEDIKSISNLQRSDLNAWEETRAIMKMLMRHLNRSQDEVISLLNQAANQKRGLTSNLVRSEDWATIEDVFEIAGRLSPESFRKHRLGLLRLPDYVQTVLQHGKLHYTKVNELLKVKDSTQQQELLEFAITHNLSIDQIQERVKSLRPVKDEKPMLLSQRLSVIPKQLKQAKVWEDPHKRKKLEKLLNEMERLLEQTGVNEN